MTQTNTDFLFQITPVVTDRAYGSAGASDGVPKFNDHLSQAATYSGDDSHNRGSSSQRTETSRYDHDDRSWNTSAPKPSRHDDDNSTPSHASTADDEQSPDTVSLSKPPAGSADGDEYETDKSDDTTAAEVAGANQSTKDNSQKSGKKSEANANATGAADAKGAAVTKKALAEAGDRKATSGADGQAANGTPSADAFKQHAEEAAKLAANAAAETATKKEEGDESAATASEGKRSKAAKGETQTAKSNARGTASTDGAVSDETVADGEKIACDVSPKATDSAEVSATLAGVTAAKGKLDADESSDDQADKGLRNDARDAARNDGSTSANKVDAAQLAAVTANPTDAGANVAAKGKDSEQATKPIGAKSETPAAAFARMARAGGTGSNGPTSETNDLPQIDPSRFIGRVAKAFQTAQDRGGTLQLRLSPPELGALRIELNVKDGVMSASLQTETANARRLLLDHLPALRDRLAEQNIRVDRFDVDVRQEGSGGQADARGSQQQQFQNQSDQSTPRRQVQLQQRAREAATVERAAMAPNVSDTGLNLIV